MKNIILALFLSASASAAGVQINGNQISSTTAITIATMTVTGSSGLTVVSTATVSGNAFSVGTSTLAVTGGKIGIGTTNPSSLLTVHIGTVTIDDGGQYGGAIKFGTTPSTAFQCNDAGTLCTIGAGGYTNLYTPSKVGIGQSTPAKDLDIVDPAGATLQLSTTTISNSANRLLIDETATGSEIDSYNYNTSAGTPLKINDDGGNILLGTGTGTQLYRCAGGTDAGWVLYGNTGAAQTLCTGGGGSLTATGVFLP